MGVCFIVGAGDFTPRGLIPRQGDLVIAADGGYRALLSAGLEPDILLGDFDSLDIVPQVREIVRFPREKDDTDVGLAVRTGFARGYRGFRLYGVSGDRPDHFFANLQVLYGISRSGARGELVCPHFSVYEITNGILKLDAAPAGTVFSVFAFGAPAYGVGIQGAKYLLDGVSLSCDGTLGVSNEFMGGEIAVTVRSGTLLVFSYAV